MTDPITAAEVLEIVEEFPKTAVFQEVTQTYAHTTGAMTESNTENHSVTVTPPVPYDSRYVDGDIILRTDVRIILPSSDLEFTPDEGMKVTIDSRVYRIVSVGELDVAGTENVVAYDLQLRR
jgi:hypothetical protein